MYADPGMIAGMMKQRIEKYKKIVSKLLAKEKLNEKEEDFLKKERIFPK